MSYGNKITITIAAALSMSIVSGAYAQDGTADGAQQPGKKPGTVKKLLRKIRHPFKTVNVDASAQKAGAVQVEGTKEHSAVMTESPIGPVLPPQPNDAQTSAAVNDIPGVQTTPDTFAMPQLDTSPIPWYAPIKKITRPIENISKVSVALGQQIMRLEGPIASLQPSMLKLRNEMTNVQGKMGTMQGSLSSMQGSLKGVSGSMSSVNQSMRSVGGQMSAVRGDISGVRGDLSGMRQEIVRLEAPVKRLEQPIQRVVNPVTSVQSQLAGVQKELADLRGLLATVLFSIYIAAAAICFGTPLAAFMVYKNRRKLFPHTHDRDMPAVTSAEVKEQVE